MRRIWFAVLFLVFILFLASNAQHIGRQYYPFPHQEMVFHYARQHSIDPYMLAALIKTESGFRPEAESPKGALGLMQIMPATGQWIAGQIGVTDFNPQRLREPEINLMMGTWYLAYLLQEFNDDLIIALAAYNGGRGNVDTWLQESRWTGEAKDLNQIPFPETRQFVRKVLINYRIYHFLYSD